MPFYSAYGLILDSELDFPELAAPSALAPTISIRQGNVDFQPSSSAPARVLYKPLSPTEVIVYYAGVGAARVQNGSSIIFQTAPRGNLIALRLFILQQALGIGLLQRGYLVLHASAAAMNDKAVAFCGPSGQGKSTLVAGLTEAGFSVMTDDVLAVDAQAVRPTALPGLRQLKLTQETRTSVANSIVAERPIQNRYSKSLCEIDGARVIDPIPLSEIYILETGPTLTLTPVPKARAAIELVRHTYGSHLLQAIGLSSRHFEQTVALARQTPVTLLSRPRDLSRIAETVEKIKRRLLSPDPSVSESGVR